MKKITGKSLFQVSVDCLGRPPYFFFDLTLEELTRNILYHFYVGDSLRIDGHEYNTDSIRAIKIVTAQKKVQPQLKDWLQTHGKGLGNPVRRYAAEAMLFEAEYDVTNQIFDRLKDSTHWTRIRDLIERERQIRIEIAEMEASGDQNVAEGKRKLNEAIEELIYLSGIFMAGYTKMP